MTDDQIDTAELIVALQQTAETLSEELQGAKHDPLIQAIGNGVLLLLSAEVYRLAGHPCPKDDPAQQSLFPDM